LNLKKYLGNVIAECLINDSKICFQDITACVVAENCPLPVIELIVKELSETSSQIDFQEDAPLHENQCGVKQLTNAKNTIKIV
jgi:hypothetical protein